MVKQIRRGTVGILVFQENTVTPVKYHTNEYYKIVWMQLLKNLSCLKKSSGDEKKLNNKYWWKYRINGTFPGWRKNSWQAVLTLFLLLPLLQESPFPLLCPLQVSPCPSFTPPISTLLSVSMGLIKS